MTIGELKKNEMLFLYEFIRAELVSHNPNFDTEISDLCNKLPPNIDKEAIWSAGRDKPCFSNIKVQSGEKMAKQLSECNSFNDYKIIASEDWKISAAENRDKKKTSYNLEGKRVIEFCDSLEGGLNSYIWKLFCICEFAKLLNDDNCYINQLIDMGNDALLKEKLIPIKKIKDWVKNFNKSSPFGWGAVTSYHMLTDLGLAVKPDIHLVRSICRLGLLQGFSPYLSSEELKLNKKAEEKAVEVAINLAKVIAEYKKIKIRSSLREVDKVLMEWSRCGLARPHAFGVYTSLQKFFFILESEDTELTDDIVSRKISLLFDTEIKHEPAANLKDSLKKDLPINQIKDYCHRIKVVNKNKAYAISSSMNENDEYGYLFGFNKNDTAPFWKICAISKIINFN